jgi:hypothetical protein
MADGRSERRLRKLNPKASQKMDQGRAVQQVHPKISPEIVQRMLTMFELSVYCPKIEEAGSDTDLCRYYTPAGCCMYWDVD